MVTRIIRSAIVLIFWKLLSYIKCYNLDAASVIVHTDPNSDNHSLFGFSVSQYKKNQSPWLLVGAPEANTPQPGLTRPGAVYRCPVSQNLACEWLRFDTEGNGRRQNKSRQGFGATLDSSPDDQTIMACAPRYVHLAGTPGSKLHPIGSCLMYSDTDDRTTRYEPCRQVQGVIPSKQTTCQAGFSMKLTSQTAVVGAVGSFYWQGQLIVQNLEDPISILETPELHHSFDGIYRGYELVLGDFNNDGNQDIAASVPKARNHYGEIQILRILHNQLEKISMLFSQDPNMGEYFGYSMTTGDFNNDGRDDIVVGGPLFHDTIGQGYERGRVHVFLQTDAMSDNGVDPQTILYGRQETGARFGLSLATAGDLNDDGYHDLVVGAPYGGSSGKGVVYIFQGYSHGIRTSYSQILEASQISETLSGFGFSLSGGMDQDRNQYPDLLVGAPFSAKAILVRSRPVVRLSEEFSSTPELINLNKHNCSLQDSLYVCFELQLCFVYYGKEVPQTLILGADLTLDYMYQTLRDGRVFAVAEGRRIRENNHTLHMSKQLKHCVSQTVYVKNSVKDKLNPIWIQVNVSLIPSQQHSGQLPPVLDFYRSQVYNFTVDIQRECGYDEICIPDLRLQISSLSASYVLGSKEELRLRVSVVNNGEESHESVLHLALPPGVTYVNVAEDVQGSNIACVSKMEDDTTSQTVMCDIGNPLPGHSEVHFAIRTLPKAESLPTVQQLIFSATVNSSNPENITDLADNSFELFVNLTAEVELFLQGLSEPQNYLFQNERNATDDESGHIIKHRYIITNRGPSDVSQLVTNIYWPELLQDDSLIFHLPRVPAVIQGQGHCQTDIISRNDTESMADKFGEDFMKVILDSMQGKEMKDEDLNVVCSDSPSTQLCKLITCTTGRLEAEDSVVLEVTSEIFAPTVNEILKFHRGIRMMSYAETNITQVPYNVTPEATPVQVAKVETMVTLTRPVKKLLPLWIWIASAISGVILLCFISVLLNKCGFFKREKFSFEEEEKVWTSPTGEDHEKTEDNTVQETDDKN